ncbi:CDC42 small effector protein 2-A-like isoform X1 [Opisthocomus hoazin]|uniref:CDC42 small effector protein 2-A-like isoform X1 n=1 Tax=Opisthocomus hoazin TaxID=30419 RepID=UPI003F531713
MLVNVSPCSEREYLRLFVSTYIPDCCLFLPLKRRRRIDRSMIGEPTNFVHTAHVGSGDLFSGMNSVSSIQNQMQSKGGYGGSISANVQMQLVDTQAG